MAIVRNIRKVNKSNQSNTITTIDYAFCNNGLSLWTYASNDINREGGTKQNLLFEISEVLELKKIIEEYLKNRS